MTIMHNIYSKTEYIKKAPRCTECGAIFFPYDEVFTWENEKDCKLLCGECFDNFCFDLNRYERAELMGCELYIFAQ